MNVSDLNFTEMLFSQVYDYSFKEWLLNVRTKKKKLVSQDFIDQYDMDKPMGRGVRWGRNWYIFCRAGNEFYFIVNDMVFDLKRERVHCYWSGVETWIREVRLTSEDGTRQFRTKYWAPIYFGDAVGKLINDIISDKMTEVLQAAVDRDKLRQDSGTPDDG